MLSLHFSLISTLRSYFIGQIEPKISTSSYLMFCLSCLKDGVDDGEVCRLDDGGYEDVEMGKCMINLRVEAGDSRDSEGRKRFMPFVPEHHLIPGHITEDNWYWEYQYYKEKEGLAACSDLAIRKGSTNIFIKFYSSGPSLCLSL